MAIIVSPLERARDTFRQLKKSNPGWKIPTTYEEANAVAGIGPRALEALVSAGDISPPAPKAPRPFEGLPADLHSLLLAGLKKLNRGVAYDSRTTREGVLAFLKEKGISVPSAMRRLSRISLSSDRKLATLRRWLYGTHATRSRRRCKADHLPRIAFNLAWTPKVQVLTLSGAILHDCTDIIETTCERNRWRIRKLIIAPTHIHLYLTVRRTDSAFSAIEDLKRSTQDGLRERHPNLSQFTDLWNRRYFASTIGLSPALDSVKRFVAAQQKVAPNPLVRLRPPPETVGSVAA